MQRLERRDVKEPAATLMFRQCRNPRSCVNSLPDPLNEAISMINRIFVAVVDHEEFVLKLIGNRHKLITVYGSRVPRFYRILNAVVRLDLGAAITTLYVMYFFEHAAEYVIAPAELSSLISIFLLYESVYSDSAIWAVAESDCLSSKLPMHGAAV